MSSLWSEFSFQEVKDWREKVSAELKGKDPESLNFKDENGLHRSAYSDSTNLQQLPQMKEIQSAQLKEGGWKIMLEVYTPLFDDPAILKSVLNGVDGVYRASVEQADTLNSVLNETNIEVFETSKTLDYNPANILLLDPIGDFLLNRNATEFDITPLLNAFQSNDQVQLLVDGNLYREKGANELQEISFVLQQAADYFDLLTDQGIHADEIAQRILFRTSLGTDYLTEIAKCRALRTGIKRLYNGYDSGVTPKIWGSASTYHLSHKDTHSNLLRLSTIGLSAAIGNCDYIGLPSYNYWTSESTQALRLSRNIQLLLKKESYIDQVNDIASGSYAIEQTTSALLEEAWNEFLKVEKEGGMLEQLKENHPFDACQKLHAIRSDQFRQGNRIMVGVNKYQSSSEEIIELQKANEPLSKSITS